jgi:ATP-dependent helicase/nuclease subunit A
MNLWNKGQEQAIGIRDKQVLVSAAAGTGKTAVLVERVLRRVLEDDPPMDMDRFLLVTFTNAAAQEMRERISKELVKRLDEAPEDHRIQKQQLLLGKAAISTLHAFCLDLVRQHYPILGIDPQSRILNDVEQTLLKQQVMDELLEQRYQEEDADFNDLAMRFGGEKDDAPLRERILQIYEFAICRPGSDLWLDRAAAVFQAQQSALEAGEPLPVPFLTLLLEQSRTQVRKAVSELERAEQLAAGFAPLKGYLSMLQTDLEPLAELSGIQEWEDFLAALTGGRILFGRMPSVSSKQGSNEAEGEYASRLRAQNQIKALRNAAKERIKALMASLEGCTGGRMSREMAELAPAMRALTGLVKTFRKDYDQAKREKSSMDFNDIEHWALKLLSNEDGSASDIALGLNQRFSEILVDEYQDINPMQETLLQALSQTGCFIMVGDIKQSIYGFRQAEPNLFLAKYRVFRDSDAGSLVRLEENYRSCSRLIEGINALFDLIMKPALGGIDYQAEGRLRSGLPPAPDDADLPQDCPLELHILDRTAAAETLSGEGETEPEEDEGESTGGTDETESMDVYEAEARVAGSRILSLEGKPLWDSKARKLRPARFRDMVVLLPAVQRVAPVFAETFRKLGIPVYADMGTGYFGAQEIQTVVSFLKVIDNPRQDIPLCALLLSPAVGFTPEELALIRLTDRQGGLYESLVRTARTGPEALRAPVKAFLKSLRDYRRQSRQDSMENVIRLFYRNTGFLEIAGAMPGGPQRQANLNAMVQRARQFEESNMKGLYQFLMFLEGLEKSGADLNPAAILSEADDVVRIMSIHKSKGLEFPVVLLCSAGRQFNLQNQNQPILIHREWGLAPMMADPLRRIQYPTGFYRTVRSLLNREALEEELRLLYVAMTRARERLIVIGSQAKAAEKIEIWKEEALAEPDSANRFLDWIGSAAVDLEQRTDPPLWKVFHWGAEKLLHLKGKEKPLSPLWKALFSIPLTEGEEAQWQHVGSRLEWAYPYPADCRLPGKISVTQAKGRLFPETDPEAVEPWAIAATAEAFSRQGTALIPRFLSKDRQTLLTGAQRGTLLHKTMAQLDIESMHRQVGDQAGMADWQPALESFLDSLVLRKVIRTDERREVPWEPLAAFLMSPLAKRMAAAGRRLRKEAAFTMLLPASRLYPELLPETEPFLKGVASDQEIMIQGTIDAFFEENGKLVLIDYKTDRIRPEQEAELVRRYRSQMLLYAEALTTQIGLPAEEKWIYALALNKALRVV